MADEKKDNTQSPSGSSSPPKQFNWFILLALFSLGEYLYRFFNGYNPVGIVWFDIVLAVLLFLGAGIWYAVVPFTLEILVPYIMIWSNLTFKMGFFAFPDFFWLVPCWLLSIMWRKLQAEPDSPIAKWTMGIAIVLALFVSIPSSSITGLNLIGQYTPDVSAAKDLGNSITQGISDKITSAKILFCTSMPGGDAKSCSKQYGVNVDDATLQQVNVDASLNTGFTMSITDFIGADYVPGGEDSVSIPTTVSAESSFAVPTTLSYSCGLTDRDEGKTNPSQSSVTKDVLIQDVILCDVPKKRTGTAEFYFNATAKSAQSSGYKEILVVGKSALDAALSPSRLTENSPVQDINKALQNAPLFKDYLSQLIRTDPHFADPHVGKDDVVQVVVKEGKVTSLLAPSQLVYGIQDAKKISFTVFLKNTGTGIITSINDIQFTLPSQFSFDKEKCGFVPQKRRISGDAVLSLGNCNLIFTGQKQNPNNIESKTISATVSYDYQLNRKQEISLS